MGEKPARHRWLGIGLVAAMVVAPFLALLYGIEAALIALTVALLLTAYLASDIARSAWAEPSSRRRMAIATAANLGLALLAAAMLLYRLR